MSLKKKQIRAAFRKACFERDNYTCIMCGFKSSPEKAEEELDAHHITDRTEMPKGGYVKENGATLCSSCHELAEYFHQLGEAYPNYGPDDLYEKIASSYEKAHKHSLLI